MGPLWTFSLNFLLSLLTLRLTSGSIALYSEPAVVVQALQKLQASESQLKEQVWSCFHRIYPFYSGAPFWPGCLVYRYQEYLSSHYLKFICIWQLLNAKRREGVIVVKLAATEQEVVDLKVRLQGLLSYWASFDKLSSWGATIDSTVWGLLSEHRPWLEADVEALNAAGSLKIYTFLEINRCNWVVPSGSWALLVLTIFSEPLKMSVTCITCWSVQTRRLLLDPAIHAEFTRMKVILYPIYWIALFTIIIPIILTW